MGYGDYGTNLPFTVGILAPARGKWNALEMGGLDNPDSKT